MNSPFPLAEGWKGWPQAARDAAYDNLAGVPDSAAQVDNRNTLSVAFRAAHAGHLDLPFGAGEREKWERAIHGLITPIGAPAMKALVAATATS